MWVVKRGQDKSKRRSRDPISEMVKEMKDKVGTGDTGYRSMGCRSLVTEGV